MMPGIYIGLGSNLDNPRAHIQGAVQELDLLPGTHCVKCSHLYRSAPMGPADQPDYINAVAELSTELEPLDLLMHLQGIEKAHGRTPSGERWGPRPLDLDILLYGKQRIDNPDLKVPHPGMAKRAFVLYPLSEIVPDLVIPGLGRLAELLDHCPPEGLQRLDDDRD